MTAPETSAMEYSKVFERLVQNERDMVGLVAYSLYKQHKRDWIILQTRRNGRGPNAQAEKTFEMANLVEAQIERFRDSAEELLQEFATLTVNSAEPALREKAIRETIGDALRRFEAASQWYRQIPTGFVSALVYTVFLIALALVLRYAGIDLISILQSTTPAP